MGAEENESTAPRSAEEAWTHFTGELARVGAKLVGPTGARTERERAEAFRYLARLVAAGQELCMEADRRHPVMARMMTPIRSFLGDGTDTLYHEAKLDPALAYTLDIERGDDLFFSAVVYATGEAGTKVMVGHLIDEDIAFAEIEGRSVARIHLGAERPAGAESWIELRGEDPFVLTRQYFPEPVTAVDAGRYRAARLTIATVEPQPPPAEPTAASLASGLERLVAFLDETVDSALGISTYVGLNLIAYEHEGTAPARIGPDSQLVRDRELAGPSAEELAAMVDPRVVANNLPGPGIGYVGATYLLADDEAVLVEGQRAACRYWSCQVLTHFLESGDYRHHQVALNDRQVDYDEDGAFRIYVSASDPGVRNWVSTQGYRRGQVVVRSLMAAEAFEPTLTVVKIAGIPARDRR